MGSLLLALVMVAVLAMVVFGVVVMLSGDDPGLGSVAPDGRALPLPADRSLTEADLKEVRFDISLRGYRMSQVDRALRRTAYDLGYKDEMIAVLEAEIIALREGRREDADLLRKAREAASDTSSASLPGPAGAATTAPPGSRDDNPARPTTLAGAYQPRHTDAPSAGGDPADQANPDGGVDETTPVLDSEPAQRSFRA